MISAVQEAARQRFTVALHGALSLDEVERAFLEGVGHVLPAAGVGMYRLDPESRAVVGVAASVDARLLEDYESYGRDDDPVLQSLLASGTPIDSSRAASSQRWESCGARAALARDGLYHSLEAPLTVHGVLCGTLNFARRLTSPAFTSGDLLVARLAGEQVSMATERALRFETTQRRATMVEDALDRMPQPVLITDLDARVVFHNRAAAKDPTLLGEARDGTRLSDGLVASAIADAVRTVSADGRRVTTSTVRVDESDESILIRTYRLAHKAGAAMSIVFPAAEGRRRTIPRWEILSPREQEITQWVSEGLSTKQIAERAFVSENTVKQHLKRIFTKTSVTSRVELVQRAWTSASRSDDRPR
jgi:DNA-binding CsgD family transcriptional regulator/GAF domain-containing protein